MPEDLAIPCDGRDAPWYRIDPNFARSREAAVVMVAVLGSFASALLLEHAAHLSTSAVILAVALSLSMGRLGARRNDRRLRAHLQSLIVFPLVAIGANEIGTHMLADPGLGDTLFVLAVAATIWVRRFGATVRRVARLATFPLVAMLIVPTGAAGSSSAQNGAWWAALIALVALAWVQLILLLAERAGLITRGEPLPPPMRHEQPEGRRLPYAPRVRRPSASTRLAAQMAAALGVAFIVGHRVFPSHWTWVVLTTFIVCSGNRGRGDVLHKSAMRLVGAAAGTVAATLIAQAFPPRDVWAIVVIFAVLAIALWLRSYSYAFWAAGVTAALALLYGYYGERGASLLGDRLEEIVVGAGIAVLVSWLLLPVRSTDVIRRDLAAAMSVLVDYVAAIATNPVSLAHHQAQLARAAQPLDRSAQAFRLLPARWRPRPDWLPALSAIRAIQQAADAITARLSTGHADGAVRTEVDRVTTQVLALRRSLHADSPPDPAAWKCLADALWRIHSGLESSQSGCSHGLMAASRRHGAPKSNGGCCG